MTKVTQIYFDKISNSIYELNPSVVPIISVYKVPQLMDGFASKKAGVGLYETTRLLNQSVGVAKTEISIPARQPPPPTDDGDAFENDVYMSLGYSLVRDAANGRNPHVWIPHLQQSNQSLCSCAAIITYGGIANPDHQENQIPNHVLFDDTYEIASRLQNVMDRVSGHLNIVKWGVILFPEKARNQFLPDKRHQRPAF